MDEKLQMLREGENYGADAICRKHKIARSLFYDRKNKFIWQGSDQKMYRLMAENGLLPEILPRSLGYLCLIRMTMKTS